MKSKPIKIIKNIIIVFTILLLICFLFSFFSTVLAFLAFDNGRYTHSVRMNGMAERVGMEIDYLLEKDFICFPKNKTIILAGNCFEDRNWNWNILIYANEYLNEDTIIGDYDQNGYNLYYWALKIENREISEAWISKSEIKESDLHTYTQEEQYEHMYFVIPILSPAKFRRYGYIDDSEVYGYYCFNKEG